MCHNSLEFSQEVVDNCVKLLEKIQKVMIRKTAILMETNAKRSIHQNLFIFIQYLFEKFTSVETVCRRECMKLWEGLVKNLPPKNSENVPDNPRAYTLDYHPKIRQDRSLFRRLAVIKFGEEEESKGSASLSIRDSQ